MSYTNGLDNPELYFQAKNYSGNASTNAITLDGSENMQPDWVWLKSRSFAQNHENYDSVRGATKRLYNNLTNAEDTNSTGLTGFNSDGFTLGSSNAINKSGETFASWNWKAGTTSGITTNGSTTITPSAYSFNQTAGFSIIKYIGNSTSGAKIAHGLGVAPDLMIIKVTNAAYEWPVYHKSLGATQLIQLHSTAATSTSSVCWNDTEPDSVNFTVQANNRTNTGTYIAYCFAEKKGYSKFSSYTGNGGSKNFIYLGFKPAFFLLKETSGADNWTLMDNKRLGYNPRNEHLFPNLSNAEYATDRIDIVSNGIQINNDDGSINQSGSTYIYMAFAESPFVNSNGVPNNAR